MIGVFDSGLGGLTVVNEILKNTSEDLLYIGDTARIPWGSKKPETIIHYSQQLTKFLIKHQVNEVVVACHTASCVALDAVRMQAKGLKVTGMIEGSLNAQNLREQKNICVLGTKTTISSNAWKEYINLINKDINVIGVSCPLFVPIVEEGLEESPIADMAISIYLKGLETSQLDMCVLACTHYPYLQNKISSHLGQSVKILNPGQEVGKTFNQKKTGKGVVRLFFTEAPAQNNRLLQQITASHNATISTISIEEIENEQV